MDYKLIYDRIIEGSIKREILGYSELHHIVPKCIGGNNNKENIARLTAKEHFVCHLLLCEIYPNNKSLKYAAFAMCRWNGGEVKRKSISGITYERLKKEASEITANRMIGNSIWKERNHSEDSIEKIKIARKNQIFSKETRKKCQNQEWVNPREG
jgi:hypothetical protein